MARITRNKAAEILGVSRQTISNYIKEGILGSYVDEHVITMPGMSTYTARVQGPLEAESINVRKRMIARMLTITLNVGLISMLGIRRNTS